MAKRLITCDNAFEANLIKGRLESEDIPCILTNENISNLLPSYNHLMGSGVQVLVREEDFSKAINLLQEERTEKGLCCPNCDSTNIQTGLGSNKLKKVFAIFVSLLVVIPFNNVGVSYLCKDCKTEFK